MKRIEVKEIVIWAHSVCRSTMALYREVKRQAGVPVTIALWKSGEADEIRKRREADGQKSGAYADLECIPVGEDFTKGKELLSRHCAQGSVHVFCVYQNSKAWRQLILLAKGYGLHVVVYAEAPCEMCTGTKALLKRMYYRFVLPHRVGEVARNADLFISQSGRMGMARLRRLGWSDDKVIPFGYASDTADINFNPHKRHGGALRVLHTGVETPYRDVGTLDRAARILRRSGVLVDVVRTHGTVPAYELKRLYGWADVVVACGLCEPWGMRINDAIHAGLPVVVSSGMGAEWLVEEFGCGCVYEAGDAKALAAVLRQFVTDKTFFEKCRAGVVVVHESWSPENRAAEFTKLISA